MKVLSIFALISVLNTGRKGLELCRQLTPRRISYPWQYMPSMYNGSEIFRAVSVLFAGKAPEAEMLLPSRLKNPQHLVCSFADCLA